MKVTLHFSCMGCFATEEVKGELKREFRSFSGRGYGFGTHHLVWPNLDEVTPDGWVAFDPYTSVTYCPTCWASIENDEDPNSDQPENALATEGNEDAD